MIEQKFGTRLDIKILNLALVGLSVSLIFVWVFTSILHARILTDFTGLNWGWFAMFTWQDLFAQRRYFPTTIIPLLANVIVFIAVFTIHLIPKLVIVGGAIAVNIYLHIWLTINFVNPFGGEFIVGPYIWIVYILYVAYLVVAIIENARNKKDGS